MNGVGIRFDRLLGDWLSCLIVELVAAARTGHSCLRAFPKPKFGATRGAPEMFARRHGKRSIIAEFSEIGPGRFAMKHRVRERSSAGASLSLPANPWRRLARYAGIHLQFTIAGDAVVAWWNDGSLRQICRSKCVEYGEDTVPIRTSGHVVLRVFGSFLADQKGDKVAAPPLLSAYSLSRCEQNALWKSWPIIECAAIAWWRRPSCAWMSGCADRATVIAAK